MRQAFKFNRFFSRKFNLLPFYRRYLQTNSTLAYLTNDHLPFGITGLVWLKQQAHQLLPLGCNTPYVIIYVCKNRHVNISYRWPFNIYLEKFFKNKSEPLKIFFNLPRTLFWYRSVYFCQTFWYPTRDTVPFLSNAGFECRLWLLLMLVSKGLPEMCSTPYCPYDNVNIT